jgi:hypothetical protein
LLLPHAGWFNFTAVGGALLYFGARRSWREMLAPLAVLMAADYYLTVYASTTTASSWEATCLTWAWYVAAMALGQILLHSRTTFVRVGAAWCWGRPRSFWSRTMRFGLAAGCIRARFQGLGACYVAAMPFYRNDLISTAIVCRSWRLGLRCWCGGAAFYAKCWLRWLHESEGLTFWGMCNLELAAGKVPN